MSEGKKPFNQGLAGLGKIKIESPRRAGEKAPPPPATPPPAAAKKDDGADAFLRAMSGVERMDDDPRGEIQRPLVEKRVQDSDDDALMDLAASLDPGRELVSEEPLRAGYAQSLDKKILKRLKAGDIPFSASLDLHGKRKDQAERELEKFIHAALREKARCVQVITGRGSNSEDGSVLKPAVADFLRRGKLVRYVLAYAECPPRLGGEGAYCILLRRR